MRQGISFSTQQARNQGLGREVRNPKSRRPVLCPCHIEVRPAAGAGMLGYIFWMGVELLKACMSSAQRPARTSPCS